MVARARRILSELDALLSDVAACKDEVTGTVRVGMIGTTARWLVPRLMDAVAQRHPKLRLVIVEGTTTGLEPQLANGQLDLAILHLPVTGQGPGHPAALRRGPDAGGPRGPCPRRGSTARCSSRTWPTWSCCCPCRARPSATSSTPSPARSASPSCPAAEIDGLRLIASLTFEGYGPAILPATAIPGCLRDRFHPVPVAGLPRRRVGVAQRSRGLPSAPTRALLELLRSTVAQPDGRPQGLHVRTDRARPPVTVRPVAGQLFVGSAGKPDTRASAPPWRRSTRRHSPSGSAEMGSRASAGTTYHEPSAISSSSWPVPSRRSPRTAGHPRATRRRGRGRRRGRPFPPGGRRRPAGASPAGAPAPLRRRVARRQPDQADQRVPGHRSPGEQLGGGVASRATGQQLVDVDPAGSVDHHAQGAVRPWSSTRMTRRAKFGSSTAGVATSR